MERKVGEIFEYNEEWYQCIVQPKGTEGQSCSICSMNFGGKCPIHVIECAMEGRSDGKSVIFKKLEKVGEPFKSMGNCYQVYKTYCEPTNVGLGSSYDGSKVVIKIKQNKENMEEREYSEEDMKNNPRFKHHKNIEQVINMQKMKPFNLEEAKAGKPVCTRDGRKARIICFDLNNKNFPIVAIINCDTEENAYQYDIDGVCDEHDNNLNLMMIPKKKEGWIIIHKEAIYDKETAEKIAKETTADVIRIQKIEWEE